jgi:hypothetical protein
MRIIRTYTRARAQGRPPPQQQPPNVVPVQGDENATPPANVRRRGRRAIGTRQVVAPQPVQVVDMTSIMDDAADAILNMGGFEPEDYMGVEMGNTEDLVTQVPTLNTNCPFGTSQTTLSAEEMAETENVEDAVPVYIVSVIIEQDQTNTAEVGTIAAWAFENAYQFLLNRMGRARDANDYAQLRLLKPESTDAYWDVVSDLLPYYDVAADFRDKFDMALQSDTRNRINLLLLHDKVFKFRVTFVLANNQRRPGQPMVTDENVVGVTRLSRYFASSRFQRYTNAGNTARRWVRQRTGQEPPTTPKRKRTYKGRRTADELQTIRILGAEIENTTPDKINVDQWEMQNGIPVKTGRKKRKWTEEERLRYNERRRELRKNGPTKGIYEDVKRKIFHHSSLEKFYQHSKAVLEVPNTWEEGYCIAMAFMKSECRIYSKDGSVYETYPSPYQEDGHRYASCPILPQFSYLIGANCDFIQDNYILLFNPYKYPSEEPDEYVKYALKPPLEIMRNWYLAARNLHEFVCEQVGMELDPNSEATMIAYAQVFGVYLAVYNVETKMKRSMILCSFSKEVDLREEEEFKVVSILLSKQHCSAITHLRSFLCNNLSANRSSLHNYCVFCQKLWTSNNQNLAEAKAHFAECIEKKRGRLTVDTFQRDRDRLVKDVHPDQFVYDKKSRLYACRLCHAKMEQGMQLGQLHHVCYMNKNIKLKMGLPQDVFVYDFECEQKRVGNSSTFVHKVNLVCVRSVYPNHLGEIERHLFHNLEDFVYYVMHNNTKNRVYLAHNGSKYDVQFIVKHMEKNMIPFEFIPAPSSMHAYLRVTIPFGAGISATFLDFRHFMPGSLKNIAISFGLDIQKGDFPHHFNDGHNEHYVGRIPELDHPNDYWCLMSKKTKEEVNEFRQWYHQQGETYCTCIDECICFKQKWSFQEEIIKYCWMDVDVLAEAARRYRDWLTTLGEGEDPIEGWVARPLDPYQYLTIPQLAMTILMAGLPEEENVTITPYKVRNERVKLAIAWMERMQSQLDFPIRHVANWHREFFEPKTKRFIDGITDDMQIFVCLNCQFHGCPKCYYEEFETGVDHPSRPGTYGKIATDTKRFLETLYGTYSLDKTHVVWEHELHEMGFSEYEKELGNVIIDREMFKGGRTEVFSPYCNAEMHPNDTIQYHDVCSLYPFVCAFTELPIGHPEHYCGLNVERMRITDPDHTDPYRGYVRCKVYPNVRDQLGLLPCHDPSSGRLEFPLKPMIGTWGTEELKLAQANGYIIDEIYEVYHWSEKERSNTFMRGYVSYFLRMKQEAEGWKKLGASSEEPDQAEQERIVAKVFVENGNISKIRPHMVRKNATNRAFAKTFLNSLWGKFCQRAHTDEYTTIHGYCEFNKLWTDPHVQRATMQFRYLSNGTWKVKYNTIEEYAQTNSRYNIFIAAKVTESARCVLHKQMIRIGPDRILYCDTDSIMALHPKDGECLTGHGLGNWVDEYPRDRIKKLYALAPKFYYLEFEEDELLKSKGIMMNWTNKELLNGFTLGKQLLELFYPRSEDDRILPFEGFIPMKNMLIGINSTSPNFEYGTMLTKETNDKKLQPVLTKRDIIPYVAKRNVSYEAETELDQIARIYTLPKGYYRSVENMSISLYEYLNK